MLLLLLGELLIIFPHRYVSVIHQAAQFIRAESVQACSHTQTHTLTYVTHCLS